MVHAKPEDLGLNLSVFAVKMFSTILLLMFKTRVTLFFASLASLRETIFYSLLVCLTSYFLLLTPYSLLTAYRLSVLPLPAGKP